MTDQTPTSRCPTCRKPTVPEHRPFCSKRCADIDLARWLGGTFVIPGSPSEAAEETSVRSDHGGAGSPGGASREED